MSNHHQVPTPHSSLLIPFRSKSTATEASHRRSLTGDPAVARRAYHAKRAAWAKLDLRQTWADEAWMRGHLKSAGLRITDSNEPASEGRLKSLLRRAGVPAEEARRSVCGDTNKTLADYLTDNPNLPLWAAVALVLEATGRFTPEVNA